MFWRSGLLRERMRSAKTNEINFSGEQIDDAGAAEIAQALLDKVLSRVGGPPMAAARQALWSQCRAEADCNSGRASLSIFLHSRQCRSPHFCESMPTVFRMLL